MTEQEEQQKRLSEKTYSAQDELDFLQRWKEAEAFYRDRLFRFEGDIGKVLNPTTHKSVEEFSIKTIDVCGFRAAEKALRLPFGNNNAPKETDPVYFSLSKDESLHTIYCSNLDLMSKLVKRGDEHAKVLRGIVVWCEINAPRYWWQECDRYSVGACCLGSNSTMHQQGKGLSEDDLVEMKENLPEGTMQKRVWMFSYQTLRRIYFQRRNHRLPQWRIFCDWIKTLPFSDDLITIDGTGDNKDKRVPDADNA